MASLTCLHSSKTTLGAAVEAFFADRDLAPATRRAYRATYGSLLKAFGTETPVTALTAVKLRRWLTRRWGKAAPATWNARLTASRVLIGSCQRQGWLGRDPTTSLERRRTPRDETRAIPFEALDALWSCSAVSRATASVPGQLLQLRLVFGCFLFRRVDLGGELDLEISQSIGLAGGNLKATSLSTAPLAYDCFRFGGGNPIRAP